MPASEIDDIFSGVVSTSSSSTAAPPSKKTKKKRKADDGAVSSAKSKGASEEGKRPGKVEEAGSGKSSKRQKGAEMVLDPSRAIEAKAARKPKTGGLKGKGRVDEEDEEFRDTRGAKRARTEDGFPIYSAAELKIDDNSGGTPLCPFDCDCCH